jgi:cell wall-associated NlpC family hydrolase
MDFFKRAKKKVLNFVADIRVYPGGFILFGDSSYKVKGPDMRIVLDLIQPGDILLRRYDHYLGSTIGIPGHFSHSALYAGGNKIIHMLGKGCTMEDILTFLRCDDIAIVRPVNQSLVPEAIRVAKELLFKHIDYDYEFDATDAKTMYCTEMCDAIYDYPIRASKPGKIIFPDDFMKLPEHFELIWRKA